ncbi:MAG TPA: hypothetical protein VKQ34_03865, partial [Candidatus Saccharimonadales bacterium]|nr:hypothetical protein [Candidatus Saccharimonadales bacterium]
SFVHGNLLDKAGQDRAQAFQLGNALSPDLQYFRLSLTPSLLDKVHPNLKAGHDRFALFEIGKAHIVGAQDGEGLPKEFERVALVFAADKKAAETYAGAPYYEAKEYLTQLLHKLGVTAPVCYEPLGQSDTDQAATYYAAGRAATIKVGDIMLGRVGEYKPAVRKALKLPDFCAGFELGLESFLQIIPAHAAYQPLPRFPSLTQDMCLKVPAGTSYAQVYDFIEAHLAQYRPDQTHHTLAPVDIYQRNDDPAHKQITLRLCLASFERTLTDTEVAKLLDDAAAAAKTELQAERV